MMDVRCPGLLCLWGKGKEMTLRSPNRAPGAPKQIQQKFTVSVMFFFLIVHSDT